MGGKRFRANSMALYAIFLVTVGLPMLALTVDVTRYLVVGVQLRTATTAACQAYANSLDIAKFRDSPKGEVEFKSGTTGEAYGIFHRAMPSTAGFVAYELKGGSAGPTAKVVRCVGGASIRPVIPIFADYYVSAEAVVKTKFSTSKQGLQ